MGRRSFAHRQRIAREAAGGKFCDACERKLPFLRHWNVSVEDLYLPRISIFYTISQSEWFTRGALHGLCLSGDLMKIRRGMLLVLRAVNFRVVLPCFADDIPKAACGGQSDSR